MNIYIKTCCVISKDLNIIDIFSKCCSQAENPLQQYSKIGVRLFVYCFQNSVLCASV